MKRTCAWCKKDLGIKPSGMYQEGLISHGICKECAVDLLGPKKSSLMDFLDNLGVPVLVVGSDVTIDYTNKHSRNFLQKEMSRIEGLRAGEVFDCAYSMLPEGCGKTIHCVGCTIRNTITETYNSGNSHLRTPAYLILGTPDDNREIKLLISTEKVADVVLLRIDKVGEH